MFYRSNISFLLVWVLALFVWLGAGSGEAAVLGLGVKVGQVTKYDDPGVEIADLKFRDLKFLGAFIQLGGRSVSIEFGVERASDREEIDLFGERQTAEVRDVITHGTGKLIFDFPLIKPFLGGGVAGHRISYSYDGPLGEYENVVLQIPANKTRFGYHIVAGAKLDFKILPIDLFLEGRFAGVTGGKKTNLTTVAVGAAFRLL